MSSTPPSTTAKKQQALDLFRQQQLPEAKQLLTELCNKNCHDVEAWHLLATINGMLGHYSECVSCARHTIDLQPDSFAAYNILGSALMALDKDDEARTCFEKASRIDPKHAEALNNLGKVSIKQKLFKDALPYLKKATAISPNYVEAYYNLSVSCLELDKFDSAETAARKACTLKPDSTQLLQFLASVQKSAGHLRAAIETYRNALKLDPGNALIHTELGNSCNAADDYLSAIAAFREAVRYLPHSAEAHYNLGHALQAADNYENAVLSYQQAIKLKPGLISAYNNLGQTYESQGKLKQALSCFNRGLQQVPGQLHCTASYPEPSAEQAEDNASATSEIHWHRALLWLLMGNFQDGWQEYEWRWAGNNLTHRPFPQSRWEGEPLNEKTILIYAEQGVGDEIMFASCFPDLIKQARHVVIDCETRLAPLFQRSFPEATIHGGSQTSDLAWLTDIPPADIQCAAGSLPRFVRPGLDAFPRHKGYLTPEPGNLARWQERFKKLGSGLKVGISWRGGNLLKTRKRSTHLQQWHEILALKNVHFVNLQYGDCETELAEVKQSLRVDVHDWEDADPLQDLDNFAAQVATLDLVISVDNATVHMAGALGIEVWVLQPFAPEWRWLADRDDSYWYPSMRHFRQIKQGAWETVFEPIKLELAGKLNRQP